MKLASKTFDYIDSEKLFALVAHQEWAMFLDSGVTQDNLHVRRKHAGFDVLVCDPAATVVYQNGEVCVDRVFGVGTPKEVFSLCKDEPLDCLQLLIQEIELEKSEDATAYLPGLIGYLSYDFARTLENIPSLAEDEEVLPQVAMGLYPLVVVIDHVQQETNLVYCDGYRGVDAQIEKWEARIQRVEQQQLQQQKQQQPKPSLSQHKASVWRSPQIQSNMDFSDYEVRFARVQSYIKAGDCYQVNLTKQFYAHVQGNAWSTYVELRRSSPAPYAAFLNLPFAQVLSNSPESFIQCRDRAVVTSPIKGTRPRDHRSKYKDRMAADELINSEKDRAENLMIVDLMRNDLSRCCELGSVKVPKLFALHSFANVHHLISTVVGRLRSDLHVLDLLKACFPGGSITGAPKIRSMQIIEELEPCRRGLYCGSIAYIGQDGSLETNIAIRTMVHKEGLVRFSAGGGLVLDSNAEDEYQELNDKVRMMSSVIQIMDTKGEAVQECQQE